MDFIDIMKEAALGAVGAAKPTQICFGTVTGVSPLEITVDNALTLPADCLILTRMVTEHTIDMTVDHMTENSLDMDMTHRHSYSGETDTGGEPPHTHSYLGETDNALGVNLNHTHAYKGRKTFLVHAGLVMGEKVLLLRVQGGQKYVVWDRIGVST